MFPDADIANPHSITTHATIEVHHDISDLPKFESLKPLPKTDLEKNKRRLDETCVGGGTHKRRAKHISVFMTISG